LIELPNFAGWRCIDDSIEIAGQVFGCGWTPNIYSFFR